MREKGDKEGDEEVETGTERSGKDEVFVFVPVVYLKRFFTAHTRTHKLVSFCPFLHVELPLCVPLADFRGDFLEGTKNSMSASRAGTCPPRQMLSYSSPRRCFMLYSKLMTCPQKTFNFDR